jgi:hypothetical protein
MGVVERVARAIAYAAYNDFGLESLLPVSGEAYAENSWHEYLNEAKGAIAAMGLSWKDFDVNSPSKIADEYAELFMGDRSATVAPVASEPDPKLTPATQEPDECSVMEEHPISGLGVSREWLKEQFPDECVYNQVVFIVSLLQLNAEKALKRLKRETSSGQPSPASATRPSESQGGDIYPSLVAGDGASEVHRKVTDAVDVLLTQISAINPGTNTAWGIERNRDLLAAANGNVLALLAMLPALMPAPVSLEKAAIAASRWFKGIDRGTPQWPEIGPQGRQGYRDQVTAVLDAVGVAYVE